MDCVLSNMAMVLYQAGDVAQAIAHQEKAVIINERCLGLDSYETSHACVSASDKQIS